MFLKVATHIVTGHTVAMKYISKAAISQRKMKTRVRREFEYMRMLKHPHIVKLYEVISTPTDIIFVMEYARRELFDYVSDLSEKGKVMGETQARRFFQQSESFMLCFHFSQSGRRGMRFLGSFPSSSAEAIFVTGLRIDPALLSTADPSLTLSPDYIPGQLVWIYLAVPPVIAYS